MAGMLSLGSWSVASECRTLWSDETHSRAVNRPIRPFPVHHTLRHAQSHANVRLRLPKFLGFPVNGGNSLYPSYALCRFPENGRPRTNKCLRNADLRATTQQPGSIELKHLRETDRTKNHKCSHQSINSQSNTRVTSASLQSSIFFS